MSEKTHTLQCVTSRMGKRDVVLQSLGRCVAIYIRGVECAMVTALFVVSSVGSSTRGLESCLGVALESVGRSVLGLVVFNSLKVQLCYDGHLYI
jgi:hypothetical protein